LKYILQVGRDIEPRHVEEELAKPGRGQAREVYVITAEQLRAEGKRQGKTEGIGQGKVLAKQQDLTNLLYRKFEPIDNAVKRRKSS